MSAIESVTDIEYPRRYLKQGTAIVAVEPHMRYILAYAHLPLMSYDEMAAWAKANDGYIMQQDDAYTPPFTLVKYRQGQPV